MSSFTTIASDAFLLDTNVLVYAYDPRDRDKQERALSVLARSILHRRAVLSVQCLSEFFSVVTQRLPEPLTRRQAVVRVERLSRACRVLDLTSAVILEGCRGSQRHNLSIWDALIWAVAKLHQVPHVLTEDAEHDRYLEGVRFLNPFSLAFEAEWLPVL